MDDQFIFENGKYALFSINGISDGEWINFRVLTKPVRGEKVRQSRLGYSRIQKRLARCRSMHAFHESDPDGLKDVILMIEQAINNGY